MPAAGYLLLELGTVGLFGLTVWHAYRRGRPFVLELISAAIFGLLLEWGDILLFGTYTYSSRFFLALGPVPILIALCWAMIIYGAMLYSDQLGLPVWAAPFADAVWAIVLDLAFDAVAIRLHFWTWKIPLTDGFFGVPAGNFDAWLYVALGFSAWTRYVRRRPSGRTALQLLAPIPAYVVLIAGILFFDLLVYLFYPAGIVGDKGLAIFVVTLAIFAAIVVYAGWRGGFRPRPGVDLIPTLARWSMHGFFGSWLIIWLIVPAARPAGVDLPVGLLVVAATMLVFEGLMLVPILGRMHLQPVRERGEHLSRIYEG